MVIAGQKGQGKTTLARAILSNVKNSLVYDPMDQYGGAGNIRRYVPANDTIEEFDNVCRTVWDHGNILFAIEEAELYLKESAPLPPYALKVVLRGRNRGIGILPITRRIALLNKNVFSLADHVFIFKFFARNDVDYCASFLGKDNAAKLRNLAGYRFIYYGNGLTKIMPAVRV